MNTLISVGIPFAILFLLYIAVAGSMPDAMDKEIKKWEREERRRATDTKERIHY